MGLARSVKFPARDRGPVVVVVSQKAVRLVMFSSTAVFLLVIPELYSLASNSGAVDFMLVIAWLTGSFDQ